MKNKAWVIFILVLIICFQLILFSMFHDVESEGFAYGSSVIAIEKWSYVSASVVINLSPNVVNGVVSPVEITFPNGTMYSTSSNSSTGTSSYSFRVYMPATSVSLANGAVGSLTLEHPLNVSIAEDVQNVTEYLSTLRSNPSFEDLHVDTFAVIVNGDAGVYVSAYGVAL